MFQWVRLNYRLRHLVVAGILFAAGIVVTAHGVGEYRTHATPFGAAEPLTPASETLFMAFGAADRVVYMSVPGRTSIAGIFETRRPSNDTLVHMIDLRSGVETSLPEPAASSVLVMAFGAGSSAQSGDRFLVSNGVLHLHDMRLAEGGWNRSFLPQAIGDLLVAGTDDNQTTLHAFAVEEPGSLVAQQSIVEFEESCTHHGARVHATSGALVLFSHADCGDQIERVWRVWDVHAGTTQQVSFGSGSVLSGGFFQGDAVVATGEYFAALVDLSEGVRLRVLSARTLQPVLEIDVTVSGDWRWGELSMEGERWAASLSRLKPDTFLEFEQVRVVGTMDGDILGRAEEPAFLFASPLALAGDRVVFGRGDVLWIATPGTRPMVPLLTMLGGVFVAAAALAWPFLMQWRLGRRARQGFTMCLQCGTRRQGALAFCLNCGWKPSI